MNTCITLNCDKPATRKGLCPSHYMKEYRRQQKLQPTYNCGLEEGHQRAIDTIHAILNPLGGSCSLWDNTVHIELQGKTFSAPLKAVDE